MRTPRAFAHRARNARVDKRERIANRKKDALPHVATERATTAGRRGGGAGARPRAARRPNRDRAMPGRLPQWRVLAGALLVSCQLSSRTAMADTTPADFSAQTRQALEFRQARRVRSALPRGARQISGRLARSARGRHADRAHAGLRRAVRRRPTRRSTPSQPELETVPARVRVRYLLERGRTRNSERRQGGGDAALQAKRSTLAARDTLPGADYYRVDALHMLGIAAPRRRAARLEPEGARGRGSRDRSARARLGGVAAHTTSAGRTSSAAIATTALDVLAEGAAAARSRRQPGDDPRREVDDRARLSRDRASSTTPRRSSKRS